jgi:hypothetical protein
MPLEKYLNQNNVLSGGYAVIDSATNQLLHTFKTDIVARAFSESVPGSRVIWLSKRMIIDTLNN